MTLEQELISVCERFIEASQNSNNQSTKDIANACEQVIALTQFVG